MPATPPSSEHTADSSVFRAGLRRERLDARCALDAPTHAALSARIEAHLEALLGSLPPQVLAIFWPIKGEFDARPLAARLIERGWRVALPVATAADSPLDFRAWTPESPMAVGRHEIPVPAAGPHLVPGIVLLPLVAFDAQGFRLGYGSGYFDRTLATLVPRPLAIGVGFELSRVADIRPQPHDQPLDFTATEAGVVRHAR